MQLTWAMPQGLLRPPAAAGSFVFIQLVRLRDTREKRILPFVRNLIGQLKRVSLTNMGL